MHRSTSSHPRRESSAALRTPSALLATLLLLALGLSSACGASQPAGPETSAPTPPPVEAEPVDALLVREIDRLLAEDLHAEQVALAAELRPAVQLLAYMRSPRAASLARELQRLPEAAANIEGEAAEDTWGGTQLLRWLRALQEWELTGSPNFEAFEDLACEAPVDNDATLAAFGTCALRAVHQAAHDRDASLTPTLRAALGELHRTTYAWLRARALPAGDAAIFNADPALRAALAWTQLPSSDAPFVGQGLLIALRSTGVSVSQRPAIHGATVLEAIGEEAARDVAEACAWPGEPLLRFHAPPNDAARNAAFDALEARFLACSPGAPSTARVAIDAGLRWADIAPVLQKLITLERAPSFLVHEVQGRAPSALPITLSDGSHGGVCGIEAHLRRDGVVLRGGGASVSLHAWAEPETLERLSARAVEAHARCDAPALVRVFVDDPSVDWGIIVRVLERMSWPQTCEETGCLNTFLMVGDPHAGR